MKFQALAALFAFADLLAAQTADLAVVNARIHTLDPHRPAARSLAVRNGKILAIGDDLSASIGPSTKVYDLRGAHVLPGFIDSHGHIAALGAALETLDLRGLSSEAEIVEKVRLAARAAKPGEWILGRAWDQNLFPSKQFPDARALSQAAPANPVSLERVDGHASWVNQKAMELADVNAATPDPPGGRILRTPSGAPSGVFLDLARSLVDSKIPPPTPEQLERRILRALNECARIGLTTVHDAGVSADEIAAYRSLAARQLMPVRVYAMIGGTGPLLDSWLAKGPEIGDYLTVRSIKLVADGALGSRGAALLEPYSDDPGNKGLLILDRAAIRAVAEKAVAKGFQLNTHAIGDAANHAALEAYCAALKGANDKRFRIEHAQVVAPADFAAFKRCGVIASIQSTHATSDMPWAADRLGPLRIRGAYAWQTFLKLGVRLANGSDFPVESPNPLGGLYAAVTRQDQAQNPPGGWFPDQRLSRDEALRSWTLDGAWAAFEEDRKGSLEPGKFADFIVVSDDLTTIPADRILRTRVTMTFTGGKIVHAE